MRHRVEFLCASMSGAQGWERGKYRQDVNGQRNNRIGILHDRIISVVVLPMIRLRSREWP
jgi:hypothetical protein